MKSRFFKLSNPLLSRKIILAFFVYLFIVFYLKENAVDQQSNSKLETNFLRQKALESKFHINSVNGLIERKLGKKYLNIFQLQIIEQGNSTVDVFEVESDGTTVILKGNNGVSLASGFHWWLKYVCHAQITWNDDQLIIPDPLPRVIPAHRKESVVSYRYYFNVCTFGYSTAFWTWERWEKEIDWMALNGINAPLAFTGLEYILLETFRILGMSPEVVRNEWFSGPAFLPWNRMGNINNWNGPLSSSYIYNNYILQKKILQRQREFGMTPILPGFTGLVPPSFKLNFPDAQVAQLSWSLSAEFGKTNFLSPFDPLFSKVGDVFMTTLLSHYGSDHLYNVDPYNEMLPSSRDPSYLRSVGEAIYAVMSKSDEEAIWIIQGWFLLHHADFWQEKEFRAFLDHVPHDNLIFLDLWAEKNPYWKGHSHFYGKKFIWCMLHNFGQRSGLYASFDNVNSEITDALNNAKNLVGIGLTPEGIETNPIIYDFLMEFAWQKVKNPIDWATQWTIRRYGPAIEYGNSEKAKGVIDYWHILVSDILNCRTHQMGTNAPAYVARPTLGKISQVGCCAPVSPYYNRTRLFDAWNTLISSSSPELDIVPAYQNDIIDITTQVLGDLSSDDENEVSAMINDFLTQITLWGSPNKNNFLNEYAYKIWGGFTRSFYKRRWALFFDLLNNSDSNAIDYIRIQQDIISFESEFTKDTQVWIQAVEPGNIGSTTLLSNQLRLKWKDEVIFP